MANDTHSDGSLRTRQERIERLRRRLNREVAQSETPAQLKGVIGGILDLLADER